MKGNNEVELITSRADVQCWMNGNPNGVGTCATKKTVPSGVHHAKYAFAQ